MRSRMWRLVAISLTLILTLGGVLGGHIIQAAWHHDVSKDTTDYCMSVYDLTLDKSMVEGLDEADFLGVVRSNLDYKFYEKPNGNALSDNFDLVLTPDISEGYYNWDPANVKGPYKVTAELDPILMTEKSKISFFVYIKADVTYRFVSSDANQLPEGVLNQLPTAPAVGVGEELTLPLASAMTDVDDTNGRWVFEGWDRSNFIVEEFNTVVTGRWRFVPSVTAVVPTTEEPTTEEPTTEKPTTEEPTTEGPTTEKPTTEEPTTEEPTTEKPTTEEPTTEEPTTATTATTVEPTTTTTATATTTTTTTTTRTSATTTTASPAASTSVVVDPTSTTTDEVSTVAEDPTTEDDENQPVYDGGNSNGKGGSFFENLVKNSTAKAIALAGASGLSVTWIVLILMIASDIKILMWYANKKLEMRRIK